MCSAGNMMQGRSSARYLFYDQVDIMGYPTEPSPLTILGKESNNQNGKELVPFTQLLKVRRGKLVLALPSIRFS